MNLSEIDLSALARLRTAFLEGNAGEKNYWTSERDLQSYDQTFAQRIGWKWKFVLDDLRQLGWIPPKTVLLDWGCGSGIAHRAFLEVFGEESISSLSLFDRSSLAMQFAERQAKVQFPTIKVETNSPKMKSRIVLLSHVITELSEVQLSDLISQALKADVLIWIEPGTKQASQKLIQVRDLLRNEFHLIAPCTHSSVCGMLTEKNKSHWCHHFAKTPQEIFMDSDWSKFATAMEIDLRDLPLSYLVLDKRDRPNKPNQYRVIGEPRQYKPHALILACNESGVEEYKLTERAHPKEFKAIKKGKWKSLQEWSVRGNEILSIKEVQ